MEADELFLFRGAAKFGQCHSFWDSTQARFTPCAVPYISLVTAIVAAFVLAARVLQPLRVYCPRWTKGFVREQPPPADELGLTSAKSFTWPIISLILLHIVGLISQSASTILHGLDPVVSLPLVSWAISTILLAIDRPKKTPFTLLAIQVFLTVSYLVILLNPDHWPRVRDVPVVIACVATIFSLIVILQMPLRHPRMPNHDIGSAKSPPSYHLRTPEDNLTLWQFMTVSWIGSLLSLGKSRQLNDEDVWLLGFEFQHRRLHDAFRELKGSVVQRLLKANGLDLFLTTFLGVIELIANLSTPVLLQQLLRAMGDAKSPPRAAVTYAFLSMVARLIASQSDVLSLWFSRRCYERSRGEMITMLYEKTLSRKIIGDPGDQNVANGVHDQNGELNGGPLPQKGLTFFKATWQRISSWFGTLKRLGKKVSKHKRDLNEPKKPASMGKILNLMRNDVYEVAQRFWEFQGIVTKPLGLILSIVLIWRIIGWSCLVGILAVIIAQGINALLARSVLRWERVRRKATDEKLHVTSQFVEAIRHLRWYGWQEKWLQSIMDARQRELSIRIITSVLNCLISFMNTFASLIFPVAAFYAYTALAGQQLRVDIAFPALQLFIMLETSLREIPGLITVLLNAYIAVGRIEEFMSEPDKEDDSHLVTHSSVLAFEGASFAWPGRSDNVLHNLNLQFKPGLTLVYGKVAAGKTALLQALLGELDRTSGEVSKPAGLFAFCAQTPWLQSMNIRENILFSSPFDETRYKAVLDACALTIDLANFKHGDLSEIGEKGIGLSGGQKARVALARAVYSRADILLLDDPLSALDHQTAELVMRRCLEGPLMKGRTVILVTHRVELCIRSAAQVVEVTEGTARIIDRATIDQDMQLLAPQVSNEAAPAVTIEDEQNAVPDKYIEEEHRATGGVTFAVYWHYVRAGRLSWWAALLVSLTVFRTVTIVQNWFVKEWGEAYKTETSLMSFDSQLLFAAPALGQTVRTADDFSANTASTELLGRLPPPEDNVNPWLLVYLGIAIVRSLLYLVAQSFMVVIVYTAGRRMFKEIMTKVAHATFRFYDVTPIGRLMNRLTSDISTIDGNISEQFQQVAWFSIAWVTSLVVIASVTPVFLIFSIALTAAFVLIFLRFLPSSQSLRRLEMVSLSPLMSNFGALLDGLMTVRAFCAQHQFQERVITVTDAFQKMDHFYWSLQAWLMYRFDALSAASTLMLTLLALVTRVSSGLTAFVLLSAERFVQSTHQICKQYGQLQMDFVSVERVVELLHLDQESPGSKKPPAQWPSYDGDIIFDNVTIRYAPHMDPALSDISCTIHGGKTTAIVGRTGSGKSTLALALLATIIPEAGHIVVDGADTAVVDKQALRTRVTFLAQDPLLFPGSMRQNLDPLNEHSDDACRTVLERVCGEHGWSLDMHIDTGGKNLSQGQRQLVGLARAVLRRSPIVVLDEATASIDMATAMQIQQTLREEMRESTVITIAHRLEAVKNADYCIVLDKGRLSEAGPAAEMLQRRKGSVADMLQA